MAENLKKLTYYVTLGLLTFTVVYATFNGSPEYSVLGFVLIGWCAMELFVAAHDRFVWNEIDIQTELKARNYPVALVVAFRYIALALIIAGALFSVPKAPGMELRNYARQYVGMTEDGYNRGIEIDRWNRQFGVPLGSSYCATFVSHCLTAVGAKVPTYRGGWARSFAKGGILLPLKNWNVNLSNYILVFWRRGGGHVGIIDYNKTYTAVAIEANTSSGARGSQHDGGGVWQRTRNLKQLSSPYNVFRATHIVKTA